MKITLPVVSLALLAGLLVSLGCWTWTVSHTFSVPDPWWLLFYLRHTLDSPDLRPIAFWSVLKGFAPALAALWLLNELDDTDRSVRLLRGARLVSGKELARKTRNKSQQQVEIAGVPMPLACESSHLLLAGSTNSGKSTAVNELLSFALARGDRAIVIDPNGHALARFGKKGDTVLNPFDKRGKGWSIFNELRKPYDVERFAKSVIPDSGDSSAQQWHGYAQQLFAETVRALTRNGEMTTERLLYWGGCQEAFGYDNLNRAITSKADPQAVFNYKYDAAGNITTKGMTMAPMHTYPTQGASAVQPAPCRR